MKYESRFWTLSQDFFLGYHAASRSPRKRTPAGAGVLKVRTTSANSVRTTREQRTNNARTAYANSYEQRANYALHANYERELTRELPCELRGDAPVCFSSWRLARLRSASFVFRLSSFGDRISERCLAVCCLNAAWLFYLFKQHMKQLLESKNGAKRTHQNERENPPWNPRRLHGRLSKSDSDT